ncbi:MAG: DciA family protein [Gammaproteobacteria bacterium]
MSPTVRRQTLWSLKQAADEAPSLAALQERIRASAACLEAVRPLIPSPLRGLVQSGPLQDGEWCLLVKSPAAATKIRQLLPTMVRELTRKGHEVTGIRVKIQALGR